MASARRPSSFGSLKDYNPRSPTCCSLQWLRDTYSFNDRVLAEQFLCAANDIVAHRRCGNDARQCDSLFAPVAYLFRHALELQLKHLIRAAIRVDLLVPSKGMEEALAKHALHRLWHDARRALEAGWPNEPCDELARMEAVILDFHALDNSGQSLRYATDSTGKSTRSTLPEIADLERLRDAVQGVCDLLSGCACAFADQWQANAEAMRDEARNSE
ncbi:MAG: hypothetical protein IT458_09400 [Planctomycetes bacterium]|nr:hypothetical protein [Planctomycetota bacterium]